MSLNYVEVRHDDSLFEFLQKYDKMFDGTSDKYTGSDYTIEPQENTKPYHIKPYPTSKLHKPALKKKIDRLIKIGLLKKFNNSQ